MGHRMSTRWRPRVVAAGGWRSGVVGAATNQRRELHLVVDSEHGLDGEWGREQRACERGRMQKIDERIGMS
jgi:hypothetical protein